MQKSVAKHMLPRLCFELARDIYAQEYSPRPYTRFAVQEPKLREIHSPAFRDRLVQCLLNEQLNPLIERELIDDTYASRKNKGTLAAIDKVQKIMRKPNQDYYLQLDIRSYFCSIDHNILEHRLMDIINRKGNWSPAKRKVIIYLTKIFVHDNSAKFCYQISGHESLLQQIPTHKQLGRQPIDKGMAIGSVVSQLFANYYLKVLSIIL
ncbi:TPA: reverse transcriptase domain-containing protein [Vibrio parahaemolyticus]